MKIKFHRLERQNPEVKSVKYKMLCTEDSDAQIQCRCIVSTAVGNNPGVMVAN